MKHLLRDCIDTDLPVIHEIINEAAEAYRGAIPADCWHEPYMPMQDLVRDISAGVRFSCCEIDGVVAGVMGIQQSKDVDLIRHAYVRRVHQRHGVGAILLDSLQAGAERPILIGTWAAASWAIRFYERNGFELVSAEKTPELLRRYWSVSDRQIETSVVLARRVT